MRIRKIAQNLTAEAKVLNASSNSQDNTYSCAFINTIVESGSNNDGSWVKYIDGTMICYITKQYDGINITTAWGNVYESPRTQLGNFPQAFIDVPTITASCIGGSSVFMEALSPSTTSIGNTWFMRPVAVSNTSTTICYIAIGKWK